MTDQLYPFQGDDVTIRQVKAVDKVWAKDGSAALYSVEVYLEAPLSEDDLKRAPCAKAATAMLDESKARAEDEGANTSKLSVKRKFADSWVKLVRGKKALEIESASVKNSPVIKVVEGAASLTWWLRTKLEKDAVGELLDYLEAEDVSIYTETVQLDLFAEQEDPPDGLFE